MGVEDEERTGVATLSGRRDDIRWWGGGWCWRPCSECVLGHTVHGEIAERSENCRDVWSCLYVKDGSCKVQQQPANSGRSWMNKLTKTTAFRNVTVWTPKDAENASNTFLRKVATYQKKKKKHGVTSQKTLNLRLSKTGAKQKNGWINVYCWTTEWQC